MIRRGAPERAVRRRKATTLCGLGRRRPRPGFALGLSRVPRINCSVSWLTDRHPIGAPRLRVLPRSLLRAAADLNGGAAQIIQGNKDIRAPPTQAGARFVFMITQPTSVHGRVTSDQLGTLSERPWNSVKLRLDNFWPQPIDRAKLWLSRQGRRDLGIAMA
jgi:hypothetical protein